MMIKINQSRWAFWVIGAMSVALLGCGGGSNDSESSDVSRSSSSQDTSSQAAREAPSLNNPFQAMSELARLGQQMEQASKEMENFTPVDPVHFSELVSWLPNPPAGWERRDPEGSTTSMGEFRLSQADGVYERGDSRVSISIIDSAYNPALYAPFLIASSFSQESTSGYDRGVTFGSHVGRESHQTDERSGTLGVLVERRFIVEMKGSNIEAGELRQWWDRLNISQLERLARS